MSHCSLLSKDAASIVGYEHDIGSGFASWQWEAPLPSDRDGRRSQYKSASADFQLGRTAALVCAMYSGTLESLSVQFSIVSNDAAELRGHFGSAEHSYGHWLDLDLPKSC